jgi:hypothetical protein
MSGSIIGLVPKQFVYILIKHHSWYERETTAKKGVNISNAYASVRARTASKKLVFKPINVSQDVEELLVPKPIRDSEIEVENVDDEVEGAREFRRPSLTGSINQDEDKLDPNRANSFTQSVNSRRNKVFDTLMKYTGEADTVELPLTSKVLPWQEFNVDFSSSSHQFAEIEEEVKVFKDKLIDLRPYMIDAPFVIHTTDRLPKVLDYFRHFHLRALPVVSPIDGKPVAIITRQDIFAYMSL